MNDLDNIPLVKNIISEQKASKMDPYLKREYTKHGIRNESIKHAKDKAKLRGQNVRTLSEQLKLLEKEISDRNTERYISRIETDMNDIKRELDTIQNIESNGTYLRSKIEFIENNEQNTNYFL